MRVVTLLAALALAGCGVPIEWVPPVETGPAPAATYHGGGGGYYAHTYHGPGGASARCYSVLGRYSSVTRCY